jgi:hypothetical protein
MLCLLKFVTILLIQLRYSSCFSPKHQVVRQVRTVVLAEHSPERRSFLQAGVAATFLGGTATPSWADTGAEVRGIPVTPFNGLMFQYRGYEFDGLKASDLDEDSIPYVDFVAKLKSGEINFVEFLAPDGDVAYATFRDGKRIRIGEGYPVEKHDGYSSPAFAIRTVKNAGVPYKFVVPALAKLP